MTDIVCLELSIDMVTESEGNRTRPFDLSVSQRMAALTFPHNIRRVNTLSVWSVSWCRGRRLLRNDWSHLQASCTRRSNLPSTHRSILRFRLQTMSRELQTNLPCCRTTEQNTMTRSEGWTPPERKSTSADKRLTYWRPHWPLGRK